MNAYELIEKHEGRKLKPYKCPAGKNTIGVGWNMDSNPLPKAIANYLSTNGKITDEMAEQLLKISINITINDCKTLFHGWKTFTENRKAALTDFVFQLGLTKASLFVKTIAAINTGRWEDAAREMEKSGWFYQVPKRAAEIVNMIEVG